MKKTGLTVGGFTQPSVAKSLIESPQAIEKGLVQQFLWVFPTPSYSKFATLQVADETFVEYLSELMTKHTLYVYCIDLVKNRGVHYLSFNNNN